MTPDPSSPDPRTPVGLRRRLPHLPARFGVPMALALALFLSGPRATVVDEIQAVDVPADVDAWLSTSEARVPGIRPDDQKMVEWATPEAPARTPVSVVYLHGFSADRHELDPVPQRVAAALGANLFLTRLTGHGVGSEGLAETDAQDWLQDAVEAVAVGRAIGERVILMGTSTGGTLAVWAAAREELRDDLEALVLVSPNFHPADRNSRLLLLPWGNLMARAVLGPERCFEPLNAQQEQHWTTCYPTRALLPMMALVERVRTLDLSEVGTPTLLVYSPEDSVVDPAETVKAFDELGAEPKRLLALEGTDDPAHHVLGGSIVSPSTTDALVADILDFLRPLVAPGGAG